MSGGPVRTGGLRSRIARALARASAVLGAEQPPSSDGAGRTGDTGPRAGDATPADGDATVGRGTRLVAGRAPLALLSQISADVTDGHVVVAHGRPAIQGFLGGGTAGLEVVDSDVGRLAFPSYDRFILPHIKANGYWERSETDLLRSMVGPGDTVLNVGANVGYTAIALARAVGPEGRVIAIEPSIENFSLLTFNLDLNSIGNVLPVLAAAGDTTGTCRLSVSPDNTGDHRTSPNPVEVAHRSVPLVSLDELLPESARPTLIASDAQGADLQILRGARQLIERARPSIAFEFWPTGILGAGDTLDEFDRLLGSGASARLILPESEQPVSTAADAVRRLEDAGCDHSTVVLTWPNTST